MTLTAAQALQASKMTEAQLQTCVIDAGERFGWLVFHPYDSRKSAGPGYPDLTMVHQGKGLVLFAELKTERGHIMPRQRVWIDALRRNGHVGIYVWRPVDWYDGTIMRVLRG